MVEDDLCCYKCGKSLKRDEITIDHIPPRGIFDKSYHSKLIKVNSCSSCNLGRAKEDEYFRNWIIAGTAGPNSEANVVYQKKVKKSWSRRPAIKSGMRERLTKANLFSPAGIYLGKVTYINIEEHRAFPVLDSIGKGILWHHFDKLKHKFPFGVDPFILHNPALDSDWMQIFLSISVPVELIPRVFAYRFGQFTLDSGDLFHVFLVFYYKELFYLQYLIEK